MKQVENFNPSKYNNAMYSEIENGIYEIKEDGESLYVTSLSFIQEPEFNEGVNASNITQYPLEDVLDKFYCHISDFYEELNTVDSKSVIRNLQALI